MVKFNKEQKSYLIDVLEWSLRDLEKAWEVPFKAREVAIKTRVLKTLEHLPEEK